MIYYFLVHHQLSNDHRDAGCYSHFALMCLVKSILFFLGIILQLVPSCRKENIKMQFHFGAQNANSHSVIPFYVPSPSLPAFEPGFWGVVQIKRSYKHTCLRENSVLGINCVTVLAAQCLREV